jgi:hypothetical protein
MSKQRAVRGGTKRQIVTVRVNWSDYRRVTRGAKAAGMTRADWTRFLWEQALREQDAAAKVDEMSDLDQRARAA